MMNLSKQMKQILSAISLVACVGGSPLAAKVVKKQQKAKVSRQTMSEALAESLPLPVHVVAGTEAAPVGAVVWGSLTTDKGPLTIEDKVTVPQIDNSYRGKGQPDSIRCPQGRKDFKCVPQDEVVPACAKATDQEPDTTDCVPFCTPGCVAVPLTKQVLHKSLHGVTSFNPKTDALLVRFADSSRRAAGANIQLSWLGVVQPTSVSLSPALIVASEVASGNVTTGCLAADCRVLSKVDAAGCPCPVATTARKEFINDFWVPVKFNAELFVHPCMDAEPQSSVSPDFDANNMVFHRINTIEGTSTDSGATPLVGRTFALYPQFQDCSNPTPTPIRPFVAPVGSTHLSDFSPSHPDSDHPLSLNVSFNYSGSVSGECDGSWVRLGIFPNADSASAVGGSKNGGTFYAWDGVDNGKPGQTPALRMEAGTLCYEICTANLFAGCNSNNPSVIAVGTCETSLLDCLCAAGLQPSTFNQILDLITKQEGKEADPMTVARLLAQQRDVLRSITMEIEDETVRAHVEELVSDALERKAHQ